jgi:outer membrane protein OmpA-like peptidoglycan-associated protein
MHKIVRVAGMEQSVVVSSEQIARAMGTEGKVVFYGIYFDTDKATLKAESTPTLAEMAKWLKTNASANVFIVGHTDMQGPIERNQKLSRDRAAAVIAALSRDHDIKAERLGAEGVGPLAPVANNTDDAGRAKNRRVEMVLR